MIEIDGFKPHNTRTRDRAFEHGGGIPPSETGGTPVILIQQFRLATNGVIVNTIVNGEPMFTTSAGTFNR